MSIKVFHTADIHLGAKFNFLGGKAGQHRKQLEVALAGIVSKAINEKADIFLIAGDLFDSPFPSQLTVSFVKEQITKLLNLGIYTAIIAGNHDYLQVNSIFINSLLTKISNKYFKIFSRSKIESWEISALNTVIIGGSLDHPKNSLDFSNLKEMSGNFQDQIKIGLFHGSIDVTLFNKYNLINSQQIRSSGLDYVALGDWHNQLEVSKDPAVYYSGSPELIAMDQNNSGKFLKIEISNDHKIEVISQLSGKISVMNIEMDVQLYKTQDTIFQKIKGLANKNIVLEVTLTGFVEIGNDLQIEALQEGLASEFFVIRIKNRTQLLLDEKALSQYPQDLLTGKFIATLTNTGKKEDIDPEIINKALQIGVGLLNTQEDE